MKSIQNEFYGDCTRWFVGRVIDNSPPPGLEGRVKVFIDGIHSDDINDVPQIALPWAQVINNQGGTSGIGVTTTFVPGTKIFGMFLDGKASQIPVVLGAMQSKDFPSQIQIEKRLDRSVDNSVVVDQEQQASIVYPIEGDSSLDSKRSRSMAFFIDNGYTVAQSAAITGTMEALTSFDPLAQRNEGLQQGMMLWAAADGRVIDLMQFASSFTPQLMMDKFETQLMFVVFELRNTKQAANSKILQHNDIDLCVESFARYYLSGEIYNSVAISQIKQQAQRAYDIAFLT